MTPFPAGLSTTWVPVALSHELRARPLARQVGGTPIVVFRSHGQIGALEDRCPHRNVPLSAGRVEQGTLRCPYHGWRFDAAGACVEVPGADGPVDIAKLSASPIAAVERHGAIFVRMQGGAAGEESTLPPLLGDPDYDHFWYSRGVWRGRALDALENILDPFHTNFIHDGLIRVRHRRQLVRQTLKFCDGGFEVTYEQQAPDQGWMSRLLEGARTRSTGRYFAPITFQGRWEGPRGLTLCATAFFTPETVDRYRPFGCWTTPKGRAPAWLKRALILGFVRVVADQDRKALEQQYDTIAAFGGPKFKSGPTDLIHTALSQCYHQGVCDTPPIEPRAIWL
jgi:phenylpropionate dioxygenase-like ring-hydroxylating dioxygenase large terminal subunit